MPGGSQSRWQRVVVWLTVLGAPDIARRGQQPKFTATASHQAPAFVDSAGRHGDPTSANLSKLPPPDRRAANRQVRTDSPGDILAVELAMLSSLRTTVDDPPGSMVTP